MDTQKQQSTINTLYGLLVFSTIASFVPHMLAQLASIVFLLVVLLGAYYYRSKDTEDGLLFNHMTYMIGTIWIGTTFIVIGMIATVLWVYQSGDHSIIYRTMADVQNGVMLDEAALNNIMMQYMYANRDLLLTASIVTIGPGILYFVYRVGNGFSRSLKGYRIANPKIWL